MNPPTVHPNDRVTFRTLWESPEMVVVVKPPGMVTQPGLGHERDALLNGLFARHGAALQRLGAGRDFGLLHRLDRETSGLLVVALKAKAYDALRRAFEDRLVGKYYWAVVIGAPRAESGVIRRAISEVQARPAARAGRGTHAMKLARTSRDGKPAVTAYRVLSASKGVSLLECRTLTGRLHQVRVHLAAVGCPILGDGLYAPSSASGLSPRLALHAHRLVVPLPTGGRLDCRSAWPSDLRGLLKRFAIARPADADNARVLADSRAEGAEEVDGDGVGDEHPVVGE